MVSLTDPASPALLNEKAPEIFQVCFKTTEGSFTVEAHRSWSPSGADRFYNLVKHRFFDDTRIFRVVPDYVVQFGVSGDPRISKIWKDAVIQDEPVMQSNTQGMIAYAMDTQPNTRSTQIYINCKDNPQLDQKGFAPFAKVIEGLEVTKKFYSGYGSAFDDQTDIETQGNTFLNGSYPLLSQILKATVIPL